MQKEQGGGYCSIESFIEMIGERLKNIQVFQKYPILVELVCMYIGQEVKSTF